jgi:hypothetical protein
MRSLTATLALALATAAPLSAGPITAHFYGTDFQVVPNTFGGSRFEGNPSTPLNSYSVGPEGFSGTTFGWLAIQRFQSAADFAANKVAAVENLAATPFTFVVGLSDKAGHAADVSFAATASGRMTYADPRLDVAFDKPTGQADLGGTIVTVALATVQHAGVNPAVTFDGGVSIPGPLPIVTDVVATLTVEPADGGGGTTGGGTGDGGPPGVPEPTSLVLAGLAAGAVAVRGWRRSGSQASVRR